MDAMIGPLAEPINLEQLTKPFPRQAIKQRSVQGKRFDYVEGHVVIHRLNDATGNRWTMEIKELGSVDLGNDWRQVTARVALTIPGLGTREHIGVQDVHVKGADLVKGAVTDALKKCATLFGVGLELYGPDYEHEADDAPPPALEEGARIVDAPVQRAQRPQEARNAPTPLWTAGTGAWRPSEAQGKRIHAMRSKAGLSQEDVKVYMLGRYGTERLAEVTREQYDDLGTWLEGMIGGEEWAIRAAAPDGAAQAPMGGLPEPDEPAGPDRWA